MLTLVAFIVALGVLIAVHEYGHYRVAVACDVRVLRFSIGFGHPILRWRPRRQRPGQDTEFVIGLLPLGGYVKMLDERESPVPVEQRGWAFNNKPLSARAAIVAAGPAANLLLAVVLYACVNWYGVDEARAVLSPPAAGTLAAQAGLHGRETVLEVADADDPGATPVAVQSFDDLRWNLTNAGIDRQDLRLHVQQPSGSSRWVTLRLSQLESNDADAAMFRSIGLLAPWMEPAIGEVLPGSAAERSGLQQGDVVLSVDGQPVADAQQLRASIQRGVRDGQGIVQAWQVSRQGQSMALSVQPDVAESPAGNGESIGRVGAYIGAAPQMVRVSHGPVDGLWMGVTRTWEMSWLTLKMIGRMVIGEASVKNLSGPLTIADYAGKSASLGVTQYLLFLALISVSLGVLNLLPLPVLDGGHLIYYLWEAVTGKTVSDQWMERLQRGGVAVLLVMMSIALFNDFARLLG
ncbi:site-2 protease [Comamonas sp. BIGb0124]|nr:site-2 protease [Comamonas sp. BIGb0124]